MKHSILLFLLASAFVFSGCNSSDQPSTPVDPPVATYDVSEGLPNGFWQGTGTSQEGDENEISLEVALSIKDSVVFTEIQTSTGWHSDAVDTFTYVAKNKADWIGLNDTKIGDCYCYAQNCNCKAEQANLKIERVMTFSKVGLYIQDTGTLAGKPFRTTLKLKAN